MTMPNMQAIFRSRFVGLDVQIPLLDGTSTRYINLDNAASTPPLVSVRDSVNRFLDYYASVHRGTGFKSQLSTQAYEHARAGALAFVNADPRSHVCIFGKNTTEAINKLARRLDLQPDDVVLTTEMEHHSNDLPFRGVATVVYAGLLPDGRLDEADFDRKLDAHRKAIRLVAVTGASNVSGTLNPIHRLAEKAHAAGAMILADCAQLAPHRRIDVLPIEAPAHLDFVTFSAHKMYAPFGTGVLIGRRDVFERGEPDMRGGGTVEIVTLDDVIWSDPPEREEAGSPNVVGAVALAAAIRELESIGMEAVAAHEQALTGYALERLATVPGLRLLADPDPGRASERLGVIPFEIEGLSHFLVAAVLGYEFGIGVRNGCFCAHPYVLRLLGLSESQAAAVRTSILAGDRRQMPGLVRASFGLYNTPEEIDLLAEALTRIARGDYRGRYHQDPKSGEYHPEGFSPDFASYFDLSV
ncbi:MAG: aminotransferase class V-fold PLP-dependent enzyme [Anaerolineales bacterium]|nr:aminotransferase class V-fold PLP-dependent enzyme [Anaerolineales bacterium]